MSVWIEGRPNHSLALTQSLEVKRQCTKRWSTDSVQRLQRGQRPQFGHPRLANRSAVQILFWFASHAKNLILGGAQTFQTVLCSVEKVVPKNCTSYADFVEYCPFSVSLQEISSSMLAWSWKLSMRLESSINCERCKKEKSWSKSIFWIHEL
jgi:hypothetical protein